MWRLAAAFTQSDGSQSFLSQSASHGLQLDMPGQEPKPVDENVRDFPFERRSDADLVREVASGNQLAVTAVWRRHASSVRRVLLGTLGSDPNLDDLMQEVFISFVRNAASIREPERLRSYLIGAAIRQARQNIRTKTRKRRTLDAYQQESGPKSSDPDVHEREGLRRLQTILDGLPERLRETFVLRFVSDISTQEVAEARGVSLATAKRDVSKAQERVVEHARRDPFLEKFLLRQRAQLDTTRANASAPHALSGDPT